MVIALVDQPVLKALKRENVEATLAGLKQFMANSSWIGVSNRYSRDVIKSISDEVNAGKIQSPGQLSEFIAASSLLHCCDGWSYLGSSISSLLRGDPHRARHLAYYAELRAATALLATEGIGVFRNDHFSITGKNVATPLGTRDGTHHFAWDCLEFWSDQTTSANLFAQIVKPYGISLENWCAPFGGAGAFAPHARQWFRQWGMDLHTFRDDHRARNISSYQPDGLPRIWTLEGFSAISFVRSLWEALEPSSVCRFDAIDRHILRISLEQYFHAVKGKKPAKDRAKFKAFIKPVVEYQGLGTEIAAQWLEFMERKISANDIDVFTFSQKLPDDMTFSAYAVMSRATLLLRAASGSTSRLFQAANHSIDSFKFWWEKFGIARGLWDGQKDAAELQDLWIDIRDSLTDIERFQNKHTKAEQTYFRLGEDASKAVITLGSCERVALWSMAP